MRKSDLKKTAESKTFSSMTENPFAIPADDDSQKSKSDSKLTEQIHNSTGKDSDASKRYSKDPAAEAIEKSTVPAPPGPVLQTPEEQEKIRLKDLIRKAILRYTQFASPPTTTRWTVIRDYLNTGEQLINDPVASVTALRACGQIIHQFMNYLHDDNAALIKRLQDLPGRLPRTMQNEENRQKLLTTFTPFANLHVDNPEDLAPQDLKTLITLCIQGDNVIRFAFDTEAKVLADWPKIRHRFQLGNDEFLVAIYLESSDYHNEGETVCMLKTDRGKTIVFKPRDMTAEAMLSDSKKSLFRDIDTIVPDLPLATQAFLPSGDHGYAQFIRSSPIPVLDDEQILDHFRQLGQIAVFAKIFGIKDLHYDNIMLSKLGRDHLIDSEAVFLPDFITDVETWTASCIAMCIKSIMNAEDPYRFPSNFYLSKEELALIQANFPDRSLDQINPYTLQDTVQNHRGAKMKDSGSKYWQSVYEGILIGLQKIACIGSERFAAMVDEHLQKLPRVRFIPVSTQDWKYYMAMYAQQRDSNAYIQTTVIPRLTRGLNANKSQRATDITTLCMLLRLDFESGDVPYFQLDLATNIVFYHQIPIALSTLPADLRNQLKAQFWSIEEQVKTNQMELAATIIFQIMKTKVNLMY